MLSKVFTSSILILVCSVLFAQRPIIPTDTIKVIGKVKNQMVFSFDDLAKFDQEKIEDQIIYNHNGEVKDTLRNMKGIPVEILLSKVEYVYDKPKELRQLLLTQLSRSKNLSVQNWAFNLAI